MQVAVAELVQLAVAVVVKSELGLLAMLHSNSVPVVARQQNWELPEVVHREWKHVHDSSQHMEVLFLHYWEMPEVAVHQELEQVVQIDSHLETLV